MSALFEETARERRARVAMRESLRDQIATGAMGVDDVAARLGLVREGVETLLRRSWSFEEAYRVAEALGFDFTAALAP